MSLNHRSVISYSKVKSLSVLDVSFGHFLSDLLVNWTHNVQFEHYCEHRVTLLKKYFLDASTTDVLIKLC